MSRWGSSRRVRALAGSQREAGPLEDAEVAGEVAVEVVADLLVAALAAGAPLTRVLAATGRAVGGTRGAALGRAGALLALGAPWVEAWVASPTALRPLVDALRVSWETGASPSLALRALARAARQERAARAAEAAARLGVRLVLPLGLCHLPAFVALGVAPVVLGVAAGSWG